MTNFEKWKSITEGLPSPDNFVEWGWYSLIASALQRRVWLGPSHLPCYPNLYTILVAPPGVGKGLVIKQVAEMLKMHKLDLTSYNQDAAKDVQDKEMLAILAEKEVETAQKSEINGMQSTKVPEKSLLIPVAANATTYEALVGAMASSYRRINYTAFSDKLQRDKMEIYGHSSLAFCLEEIASLFRKRTEDLVNFCLEAYDCGDYEYDTRTRGKDRIRRCCLNIFGGTTPDFMQSTFDDRLLNQGFSSRTHFIFANKNRKNVFWIPSLTKEQLEYKYQLSIHIKSLTKLYGNIKISTETEKFLIEWWDKEQNDTTKRSNTSPKLVPYYARKNIHIMKLAIAIHFGESTDMFIGQEVFEQAIEVSRLEEKSMHLALNLDGANPLFKTSKKIEQFLRTSGAKTLHEILTVFYSDVSVKELEQILFDLVSLDKIGKGAEEDEHTKERKIYYRIK